MRAKRQRADSEQSRQLAELEAAFAVYRRAAPGQRISQGLRDRVVTALAAGVPARAVSEACGVTPSQVWRWRREAAATRHASSPRSRTPHPGEGEARVLSVVDAGPDASAPGATAVEIRIGSWLLSLSHDAG